LKAEFQQHLALSLGLSAMLTARTGELSAAEAAVVAAQTRAPESPHTQAARGWLALRQANPLQAVEDGDRLRLLAPNRYVVDWVNQNCTARISELVDELVPAPVPQVTVEIGSRRQPLPTPTQMTDGIGLPVQPRPVARPPATFESQPGAPPRRAVDPLPQFGGRLNAEFTFANFVEGKSNQLARAAALQVSENPGRAPIRPFQSP
jgi:chromosomal replication initiation ATPase DnaA